MNIRIIVRQVWQGLRKSPSDSVLHILGVAFVTAFASVMMVRTVNRYMPVYPENDRSRLLVCDRFVEKYDKGSTQRGVGSAFNDRFVNDIPEVECSDLIMMDYDAVRFVGDGRSASLVNMYVGPDFWKIFDFDFVDGGPIPEDGYDALSPKAVITASAARYFFGTEKASGRKIGMKGYEIAISGVVKDVPSMSILSFSQIWLPKDVYQSWGNENSVSGFAGSFSSVILCRESGMRDAVEEELYRRIDAYNASGQSDAEISLGDVLTCAEYSDQTIYSVYDDSENVAGKQFMILFLMVLLVSVNITGLVFFRMKLKEEELGVRRSFGATRRDVISQIMGENLVLSFAGGVIGVIAGALMLLSFSGSFSTSFIENTYAVYGTSIPVPYADLSALLRPSALAVVLLCVVLVGLFSSLLPALSVSRKGIVNLIDKEE